MNIKQMITTSLINQLGAALASGAMFHSIKDSVQKVESRDLSGAEKKTIVVNELQAIGCTLAGWLLNVLLELAVAFVKQKAGTK